MPKLYPFLRPNRGIPGSSHGSRVYSDEEESSVNISDCLHNTNENYNWSTQFQYIKKINQEITRNPSQSLIYM